MKKCLLTIVTLGLIASQLMAQSDPKAQEILKGVSAKYKSYKSVSTSFKLNLLDQKSKKTTVQNGTVSLKGAAYNFAMSGQTVMCDGKTTWTYMKESNEVQVSDNKPSVDAISPTTIFTMYEKGFKSKFLADKKVSGKAIQLIELTPDDSKKSYFKIQLTIDKAGKYVNEAKVFDKNGNIYTYSIVKFTPNAIVTDDLFSFNKAKYPGVEIVDLR
jgi:outer membrane lipoprotein-sorting protein